MEDSERLVVVTGGTKGIGRAVLERFVSEGWSVATCSRNEADLKILRDEIQERHGILIHIYEADLSKIGDIKGFVEFIGMTAKPVEVLVNNTGVFIPGSVLEEEVGTLEKMMNTNLYSAYYLTRMLVPEMRKKQHGHIFNLCSVASLRAYPNGGSYSISKFALYGFSQALREELKEEKIRVTSVLAGAVRTPSWDGVDLPDERFMKPEDIAEAIYGAYSLSDRTVLEDLVLRPQLGDI